MAVSDHSAALAHYQHSGRPLVYEAEVVHSARVDYFDTASQAPAMIGLIEFLPATQAMFETFRTAARDWDGTDPVRVRVQRAGISSMCTVRTLSPSKDPPH